MHRVLIWALRLLPVLGLPLVAIGVIGDLRGWWGDLGYTSNVLAGLTGACFGVPIAYFVIQDLVRRQEGLQEQQKLRELLDANLRQIHELGLRMLGLGESIDLYEDLAVWAGDCSIAAASLSTLLRESEDRPTAAIPDEEWPAELVEELRERSRRAAAADVERADASAERLATVDRIASERSWRLAQERWRLVFETLIPSAAVVGVAGPSDEVVSGIADFASTSYPLAAVHRACQNQSRITDALWTSPIPDFRTNYRRSLTQKRDDLDEAGATLRHLSRFLELIAEARRSLRTSQDR